MSHDMKSWALAYAKIGWPVFRVTGHKTPLKGSHGHLDATIDPNQIDAWWTARPGSNIAVALGEVVVIDADGPAAIERLKRIFAAHNYVPDTAMAGTSRGKHLYYRAPPGVHVRTRNEPRQKSGDDGIDIKAHGGWTVLPPSMNVKTKLVYKWITPLPLSELPMWLIEEIQGHDVVRNSSSGVFAHLGDLPSWLREGNEENQRTVTEIASDALKTAYSPAEHARLVSALCAIPSSSYDIWFTVGMALQALGWERSDGIDIGFDLFDDWSQTCPNKYAPAACEEKWNSFGRSNRQGVTVGTIFHLAQQHGWNGGAPEPLARPLGAAPTSEAPKHLNGHASLSVALPAAMTAPSSAIFFPDRTEEGKPRPTYTNAIVAIEALGIACEHDLFHNRMLVGGQPLAQWSEPELSDNSVMVIRSLIRHSYGFDPNKQNTADACQFLCLKNQFDPVLDYLDDLSWDGTPRLESWLARYMGANDTELNRAIGQLALVAAVRRARRPGTKFDQIVVLEGREGKGKSEALEVLAGKENFSDQKILGVDDRMQQELLAGVWIYEIAELTGMRKAEIEHVKAFASRTTDRARPAYGRFRVDQPRRAICFATTNRDDYLISETGNRRFWPVATSHIDVKGLRRDRDQIWAEAAVVEARGGSIVLDERLWSAAGAEQEDRLENDPWFEMIYNYLNMNDKVKTDVSVTQVLVDNQFLQMSPERVDQRAQNRAAAILRRLGYTKYRKREGTGLTWRYRARES